MSAVLLLMADGRLPTGGYAHSGGVEEAVAAGRIRVLADLEHHLVGRLATVGASDAAAAALAWAVASAPVAGPGLAVLDAEVAARIPSPAARAAGRAQARGLLRLARRAWPSPAVTGLAALHPAGPCWSVALGVAGAAAGLDGRAVALLAAASTTNGPAWAAVRLLGLDPLAVASLLAGLSDAIEAVADAGAAWASPDRDPCHLPASGGPLSDIGAEHHAAWEVRLFAS